MTPISTTSDAGSVSKCGLSMPEARQPSAPDVPRALPINNSAVVIQWGENLTADDFTELAERWITPELALASGLRRVTSSVGKQMFSRKNGDLSGVIIPNLAPWDPAQPREYRLRLDSPPVEVRADGTLKETQKYIQPTGRPNLLYFPVGVRQEMLDDTGLPVLIVEGEFKGIAAWRCANHKTDSPRFLPISVAVVYSYRGTIGKTTGPRGERRDVKGMIPDIERIAWKGRKAIVAYDADAQENPGVRRARWRLIAALRERGATVGILHWPIEDGKGIDDWLSKVGPDRVLSEIAQITFRDWRTSLIRNNRGDLRPCYENAFLMLENSPEWAGVLGYNEFTGGYVILKPPPPLITAQVGQEIEDQFDTEVVRWLERKGVMVKPNVVHDVVDVFARRNSYHPIREYLEGLPAWDGVHRIGTWLIEYCGVDSSDENPNRFAMAVGEKFLISAVARVMEPGCKVDHLLVLEGAQGIGKSTAAKILCGDAFFSDQLADMGSKDCSMQLRGIWIMELAELDALNRPESSRAKAFFSQQRERFRPPYGRRVVEIKRQCVFIGTTNADAWLKDETGGRRFWPVRCRSIDLEGLKRDRDQLWAEALHCYRSGASWWLTEPDLVQEAMEEQRKRYPDDVWSERLLGYATELTLVPGSGGSGPRGYATVPEILDRLGVDTARQDQQAANRVARCLKAANWERYQYRLLEGKRQWRYRPGREEAA